MATNRQQNLDKVGQSVKNWNQNPVRPVYISPNDRRAPGAVTNATSTPQMQPSVQPRMLTGEQLAPLNQKFANKGIFAGDPSTVPFSDVTADARAWQQSNMTPPLLQQQKPITPATPQDKAAVLMNQYKDSLMNHPVLNLGDVQSSKAPADAKSFLNTPSYDMDYGTIEELQKTRDGKIALADIQERQKRFTQSITAIATQMGVGEIGRSDEGMQEFYERAIYGNPEYSPLIAGFAKEMFMKTMPTNIKRKMEREMAEERKQMEIQKRNQWAEQTGQKYRYNEFGEKYDLPEEPKPVPTISETVAQQKQTAEEKLAALQQQYPDKKFKTDPVSGNVTEDTTKEDSFNGSDLYKKIEKPEKKTEIRDNIAMIEAGDVMDAKGNIVSPDDLSEEDKTSFKARADKYVKRWKAEEPATAAKAQPAEGAIPQTTQQYLSQNWESLMQTGDIIPEVDNGDGTWQIRVSDENGKPMRLDSIELDPQYVQWMKQQSARQ